ncbi:MAG: adenosylcobalamin-dependent ribonucleoside-diphosphate reductase [Candidatus Thorarchaeota archaeon]
MIHQSGGGCTAEGTIIPTQEYGFIPIEKLPAFRNIPPDEQGHSCDPFHIFAFDEKTKTFTRASVSHVWKFVRGKGLKINFGNTGHVIVTPWHPFYVYDTSGPRENWHYTVRRADDLKVGDWLVKPSFSDRLFLNEEPLFWWLYGFFLGDGCLDTGKNGTRIRFFTKDPEIIKHVQDALEFCAGSRGSIYTDKRNGLKTIAIVSRMKRDNKNSNQKAIDFFERIIELNGGNNAKKQAPSSSFICPNPYGFIAGLIDSDGWIGNKKGGIAIGNEALAETIIRHLSLIGVNPTYKYRTDTKKGRVSGSQIKGSWWQIDFMNGFVKWLPTVKTARKTKWVDSRKIQITSIAEIEENTTFYDFTVPGYENYLGGNTQFVTLHNTGFSFSRLRPEGDIVKSTGGIASGPISFMKVFNASTEIIKQGGRRRGANMGVLRVDHPDILKFITCKEREGEISNFNISVALTDAFMEAVSQNIDFPLINPRNNVEVEKLNARMVFNKIVDLAWQNGEPGIIFIDRINQTNPMPHIGEIESTNPCGEVPLHSYSSCNLGSINLARFVRSESGHSPVIDFTALSETIAIAVRFLDNIIDANDYPLPEIHQVTLASRMIGLGVMGFADLLYLLEIPYDSEEAMSLAEKIMGFIRQEARQISAELAVERGPFPNFQGSTLDRPGLPPMRNATVTTIAPTGSISIIANCSGGIEPVFALSFTKNVLEGEQLVEVNPIFRQKALERGLLTGDPVSDHQLLQAISKNRGRLRGLPGIPEDLQRIFVTAPEIDASWHVQMQATFQMHGVENAVSKTINFPNSATRKDIADAFLLAYRLGCKGLTVYRDGSRQFQVLETKSTAKLRAGAIGPRPRPETTVGGTIKNKTGCGSIYITINEDDEGLAEIFVRIGKSGGCAASQAEATGRLISLALRSGVAVEHIIETLQGIRCPSPAWTEGGTILSCSDAVAKTLASYTDQGNGANSESRNINGHNPQCPDCGELLVFKEGCVSCPSLSCGYSECS